MIKVEEARNIVLNAVKTLDHEEVDIIESTGRVLAGDVFSGCDIPVFDYSAMDGYALRSLDTKGASPSSGKILKVVGEHRAGCEVPLKVDQRQAVKIMTGAPIPEGADAVIMVENTKGSNGDVEIIEEAEAGSNIRLAGEDVKEGSRVMYGGSLVSAAHIGMLASLGIPRINVTKRPSVAILATGDEVIGIEEEIQPGRVRNSNAYSLNSQVIRSGGIPVNKGVAGDDRETLRRGLISCLDCDVIITSGGVSMGEYDYVKEVMNEIGMEQKFWKVAMRPGKPNLFGLISGKPFFGLPGNPVSSMVSFEVFVRPAIHKMLGQREDDKKEVTAILQEDIKKKKDLKFFIRAQTSWQDNKYITKTTGPQGSGILSSMVLANSLIILSEEEEFVAKGTGVKIKFL
jgi:molybdopterin molybdotransferase